MTFMKVLFPLLLITLSTSIMAQNGAASTTKKTFSRTTTISEVIAASPEKVWAILTQADGYTRWNSTIVSLTGTIEMGQKIQLVSTLDPSRTFKLKVKELVPNQRLVWGDGLGQRTYTLEAEGNGTLFTMTEKIGGPIFPLFAKQIPSFDESFEQFAADLKKEAEQ